MISVKSVLGDGSADKTFSGICVLEHRGTPLLGQFYSCELQVHVPFFILYIPTLISSNF